MLYALEVCTAIELILWNCHRCRGGGMLSKLVQQKEPPPLSCPIPFTLLPFLPSYSLSLPSPPSPFCRSRPPLIQLGDLGSAVSSPSGFWVESKPKSNLVHFSFKIWHLVATNFMTSWEATYQILCSLNSIKALIAPTQLPPNGGGSCAPSPENFLTSEWKMALTL